MTVRLISSRLTVYFPEKFCRKTAKGSTAFQPLSSFFKVCASITIFVSFQVLYLFSLGLLSIPLFVFGFLQFYSNVLSVTCLIQPTHDSQCFSKDLYLSPMLENAQSLHQQIQFLSFSLNHFLLQHPPNQDSPSNLHIY